MVCEIFGVCSSLVRSVWTLLESGRVLTVRIPLLVIPESLRATWSLSLSGLVRFIRNVVEFLLFFKRVP